MTDMTRRRFIETAGLAAATAPSLSALAQAPASAQEPAGAAAQRRTTRARDLTEAELEAMFHRCSNAGRWGPDDELGTLNYITPAKRIAAASLVKTGEVVSVGRDLSTTQDQDQRAAGRPHHDVQGATARAAATTSRLRRTG